MFDLVELARAKGLERCARRLADLGLVGVVPSLDPLPSGSIDVPTALGLLRRRGLESALIRRLLLWLEARPLELGLFSWDVLCSALLDKSDPSLLAELRKNALRVRPILPAPGSTFANLQTMSSTRAVETFAAAPYRDRDDDSVSSAATQDRALGALDELRRRYGVDTLIEAGAIDSTVEFARLLHLSHLPTLATLYADYAFHALRARAGLSELVEMLLDVGAGESLPTPSEFSPNGTAEQLDLLGYAAARTAILTGGSAEVFAQLKSVMRLNYGTASIDEILRMPRSHVVLADAAAEQGELLVPFEIVDQIASANPSWRYVHRVRAVMSGLAQQTPGAELPLIFVENFLDVFGNDFSLWYETGIVGSTAPWRPKLVARVASEVTAVPHDFMAWVGLASLVDNDVGELVGEVNSRAAAQCDLTLPS